MSQKRTALVISAHAADFVWRCGGAIALHQQLGYEVTVVCLSFGERGESAKLWKQGGMTLDRVKAVRRREAENAAAALGVQDLRFLDLGDYPLELDRDARFRLVDILREVQPRWMMSHSKWDPYNTDHMYATQVALECRMIAQAWGHNPGEKVLGAPQLYLFEPHQTEQMGWKPDVFLDITPVWDRKRAAIGSQRGGRPAHRAGPERGDRAAGRGRRGDGARGTGALGADGGADAAHSAGCRHCRVGGDDQRAAGGQLDGACGDRAVARGRHSGAGPDGALRHGVFRGSAGHQRDGAGLSGAGDRCGRSGHAGSAGDGVRGLVHRRIGAGHGEGDAGRGERAGNLRGGAGASRRCDRGR